MQAIEPANFRDLNTALHIHLSVAGTSIRSGAGSRIASSVNGYVIQGDNAAPALAILRTRLAANHIVIITVGSVAHRFVEVPFFSHQLRLPTGPIRLANDTGAALLPAFAFAQDSCHFDVTIDTALPKSDKQEAFVDVAAAYAKRLEPFVKKYPEQWTGWDFLLCALSARRLPQ